MKKFLLPSALVLLSILATCVQPGGPPTSLKMAAVGDSITMGIQDAGLLRAFQQKSYPYLIAQQMGGAASFQQPYVESPGIGVPPYKVPLALQQGAIIETIWNPTSASEVLNWILPKLSNLGFRDPYNNLGINGARLFDLRHTTSYSNSRDTNYFFDVVLRNITTVPYPNFGGTTAVQQAVKLKPEIVLLWIGSNDILGSVLVGCGTNGNNTFNGNRYDPTSSFDFRTEYQNIINDLTAGGISRIVMCKIPAYLPFVNALDGISRTTSGGARLCVFDPKTLAPIDFGGGVYLPLLLQETDATHLLLSGGLACITTGQGLPGSSDLAGYTNPGDMIALMKAHGLAPNESGPGTTLTGDLTITPAEEATVRGVIDSYNGVLASLSASYGIPLVDIIQSWWGNDSQTPNPFGGFSGLYALQTQDTTTFSLDGIHPSNLGHALTANAFIRVMNQTWGLGIPELDPGRYKGQYSGLSMLPQALKALEHVREIYPAKTR